MPAITICFRELDYKAILKDCEAHQFVRAIPGIQTSQHFMTQHLIKEEEAEHSWIRPYNTASLPQVQSPLSATQQQIHCSVSLQPGRRWRLFLD